ncbi:MAG: helicase-related protein [Chlamydiota bacterium]|nr:helicase-related protein [Chlamydiota bacterium]
MNINYPSYNTNNFPTYRVETNSITPSEAAFIKELKKIIHRYNYTDHIVCGSPLEHIIGVYCLKLFTRIPNDKFERFMSQDSFLDNLQDILFGSHQAETLKDGKTSSCNFMKITTRLYAQGWSSAKLANYTFNNHIWKLLFYKVDESTNKTSNDFCKATTIRLFKNLLTIFPLNDNSGQKSAIASTLVTTFSAIQKHIITVKHEHIRAPEFVTSESTVTEILQELINHFQNKHERGNSRCIATILEMTRDRLVNDASKKSINNFKKRLNNIDSFRDIEAVRKQSQTLVIGLKDLCLGQLDQSFFTPAINQYSDGNSEYLFSSSDELSSILSEESSSLTNPVEDPSHLPSEFAALFQNGSGTPDTSVSVPPGFPAEAAHYIQQPQMSPMSPQDNLLSIPSNLSSEELRFISSIQNSQTNPPDWNSWSEDSPLTLSDSDEMEIDSSLNPTNLTQECVDLTDEEIAPPQQAPVPPIVEKTKLSITDYVKKKRCELNNTVLPEWQKYSNEICQALVKSNNLSGFYLDDLSPQTRNNLLEPLIKFHTNSFKSTADRVLKEFFFHFGIKATKKLMLPNVLKGILPIKDKGSESIENKLSPNFAIHTALALYKFKQDQYSRLVSSKKAIETNFAPQNIPCIVPVPSSGRMKLIPLSMIIQKNGEAIDLTTHISGITNDEENCCATYLKEKDLSFELDDDKLIVLECNELQKLGDILKAETEVAFYAMEYRGAVQGLSEEINKDVTSPVEFETLIVEEESQRTPSANVKHNSEKPLLKKRSREEFEDDTYEAKLIEDEPSRKKQKVNDSKSISKGKFVSRRKNNEARDFDINSVPLELDLSKNYTSDKQGTLISITGESVANEQLNSLGLNATLNQILSHTIKSAVEKIANKSALRIAKNWGQLDFPNIEKIKEYIKLSRNEKEYKSASFPLIETLKNYQIDTLRKIRLQIQCGVTPLCSLWMGLGKTLVYANLCAELISEGRDGVIPILVPAATREKTKSEMRKWISEAKITALKVLNQHDPQAFKTVWQSKYQAAKLKYADFARKGKSAVRKPHSIQQILKKEEILEELYWDTMYPLLSTAYLCKEHVLPLNNLMKDTISLFLNKLSIDGKIAGQLNLIDYIAYHNENPTWSPPFITSNDTRDKVLDSILQISQLSNYPRNALPEDASTQFSKNQCLNLIHYDICKIVSPSGQDCNSIINAYGTPNAIIILGYEQLKNTLQKNEGLNKLVQEKSHLAVFADEASKYHTANSPKKKNNNDKENDKSSLSKFIGDYSQTVQEHGGFFLGVTATPFENNIQELIQLLTISNKKGDFKASTISSILEVQKKAVERICDSFTESKGLESDDILKSFGYANVLAQIIEQCVVSKSFNDRDVIEVWGDNIPKEKRVLEKISISQTNHSQANRDLAYKINKTCAKVYNKSSFNVSDLSIIALTPNITRLLIDQGEGGLNIKNNTSLDSSITSIAEKINEYKKSRNVSVLDKYFLAKTLVSNKVFSDMIVQNSRAIIVYDYNAEAKVLKTVLEKYYDKPVIEFGENDKKRSAALKELSESTNAVLLLPAKAGGVGLNLGYVDNLVFLRNSWNPALQRQFIARVLRVGRGGDRNVLELFFENIHSSYVKTKFTEKTLASEFFMSSRGTLKERLKKWCEILTHRALQNFMLRSTNEPGFYNSTPILEVMEENGQPSIERLLVSRMKEIQEAVNYEEFTEIFEKISPLSALLSEEVEPSPMEIAPEDNIQQISTEVPAVETSSKLANALQTLPPSKYQRIPLDKKWSVEEVKRFAAAIADPNNQNMVNQYFGEFISRLRKEKNRYADQIRANGFTGATQFMSEKFSVLSSNVSDIYRYSQTHQSYVLVQTEGDTGNSRGLIYKTQNGPNNFRYDVLMPIGVANEAEKRYLSSPKQ